MFNLLETVADGFNKVSSAAFFERPPRAIWAFRSVRVIVRAVVNAPFKYGKPLRLAQAARDLFWVSHGAACRR